MRRIPAAAFAILLLAPSPVHAADELASRVPDLPLAIVPFVEPQSFDLLDWRAEQAAPLVPVPAEIDRHSHFGIKQHIGVAAGYDNGVVHGSLGLYMTVAEWGRWNYGVPSPALGFGRYPAYDPLRKLAFTKEASTLFISLASIHYRAGRIESIGMNWYINLEQIFDLRQNTAGSQIGITLSSK